MRGEEPFDFDPGYRLAWRGREATENERLALFERIFDPLSRQRRSLVQPGWRCLEFGAGRGSMAVWLAERVGGFRGHVVATDIDVSFLKGLNLPNLEVRQHNILNDPLDALGTGWLRLTLSAVLACGQTGDRYPAYGRCVCDRADGSSMKTGTGVWFYP